MGIELKNHGTGERRDNRYTIWDLKLCRQKDYISIDSRPRVNKGSSNIHLENESKDRNFFAMKKR